MKELLIEEGGSNKQGGSVWIGRDGSSSVVVIPLADIFGGNKAS